MTSIMPSFFFHNDRHYDSQCDVIMRISMAIINAVIMTNNNIIMTVVMIIIMTIAMTCIVLLRELRQHGSGHSPSTFLCCDYWSPS